jgi:N-acetylated-alpha-linked acidic dipeptidase
MQPNFDRTRGICHPLRFCFAAAVMVTSAMPPRAGGGEPAGLLGFGAASAAIERAIEKKFDAQLNPDEQRAWLEQMSAEPNHVGTPHDKANAELMLGLFRDWGWEAHLETFSVLYPTPKKVALEMTVPKRFTASLREPALEGDRTSAKTGDALPPYNAYGADGDVTAEVVYVNQGMPDDYKELELRDISVQGRIVIARYGGGWRGLKPKLAYEHGAVGCIIYSDPRDDGYSAGDVYPKGGLRPPEGVQRGSVEDMTLYPGDPLTPGVGATEDARRLAIEDAKTVLKIPVLPISYGDAQPFLAALEGPVAPPGWRGGLPITYHIGPGPAKAHLTVVSDWSRKPIYDVIATIRGSEHPDEWIIRGNHHDGWVFGAWDPLSANVVLMAEAKAIGALVRGGWKPKRTIVYASWDGEEPGLIGSTEWVEAHADELQRKAVLYVNSDSNGRGFLEAGGSHSLATLVHEVAAGVDDPQTGTNVLARLRARALVQGGEKGAADEAKRIFKQVSGGAAPPIGALGSGSDYSPFLQHLGVASLNLGFGGEDKSNGIYHSVYDSFDHYLRFGDPGFAYGIALAETVGHVVLRMTDADVLPMRFGDFADAVGQYVDEVHKLTEGMREETERQHLVLDDHAYELAADPTETHRPPEREANVPFLNFAPLDNARARLSGAVKRYDEAFARAAAAGDPLEAGRLNRLNALLAGMERTLTHNPGLPGREWYRHMIYAPGLHTGYGVKTLPGVREAIEQRRWEEAEQYVTIVAESLNAYSDRLEQAAAVLEN